MREFYRPRSEMETLVKVGINDIIEETIELTRPRWRDVSQREGVPSTSRRKLEPELPFLVGDPTDLREALTNLIFNAVDAMPLGGFITITSRLVTKLTADADKPEDKWIEVDVRDDGLGMDGTFQPAPAASRALFLDQSPARWDRSRPGDGLWDDAAPRRFD